MTMAQLVELSSSKHRKLRVSSNAYLEVAAKQHVINIRANEIGKAVSSFPVFFCRHPTTGNWSLSAVSSLEHGHNLFVENGRWTATYQPSSMQTYPLYLMQSPENKKAYTVGIDENSNAFSEEQGEALFDDNGKASLYLSKVTALLEASIEDDIQTHLFTRAIEESGLHKSIDILVYYDGGAVQTIKGLCTVDEDKLQSLTASQLEELSKKGYLLLVHAMLVSIFQLNLLIRKNNRIESFSNVKQIKLEVARDRS